jgi:5-methylcytosine-specific restriction endonuclease McrA
MARIGRPSALTPSMHAIIIEAIAQGFSDSHACELVGVSHGMIGQWEKQGNDRDRQRPVQPHFAAFAIDLSRARAHAAEQKLHAAREAFAHAEPLPRRVQHPRLIPVVCGHCQHAFALSPSRVNLPPGQNYCSPLCSQLAHRKNIALICDGCGKRFLRKPGRLHTKNYCEVSCFRRATRGKVIVVCDGCGILFERLRSRIGAQNYCLPACYRRASVRHASLQAGMRARCARRRARKAEAPFIEDVDLEYLYQRDNGVCQLCFKRCRRVDASRDHIIPLSKGGEESKRNAVLAHLSCNSSKGNRTIPQNLRLWG